LTRPRRLVRPRGGVQATATIPLGAPRHVSLEGIPERAYDYVVNGRPAIEWIIDRYQVRTDRDSEIVDDPNAYSDDPRYIVDLVGRILAVSLQTLDIVGGLPEFRTLA
jgi:predicted helicase